MFRYLATRERVRAAARRSREEPQHGQTEATPILGTLLATQPGQRLKGVTGSAMSSIIVHTVIIGGLVWATTAESHDAPPEPPVVVELYAEAVPAPPPPPPPVNVEEPIAPIDVADGFRTLSIPDIVPPEIPPPVVGIVIRPEDFSGLGKEGGVADGVEGAPTIDDLIMAPRIVPFTVKPELLNGTEVTDALVRYYPTMLRDAGIGGQTLMWFFIDETGKVLKTQVKESSGYAALDEAAGRVAELMRFSPAQNRERKVQVWIEIPIVFTSR